MAGAVLLTVLEGQHNRLTLQPADVCPAALRDWPKPRCVFMGRDGTVATCPFVHNFQVRMGGRWITTIDVISTLVGIHLSDDRTGNFRVICLRQESKDTPPGAL
jgi:hypothetical protein